MKRRLGTWLFFALILAACVRPASSTATESLLAPTLITSPIVSPASTTPVETQASEPEQEIPIASAPFTPEFTQPPAATDTPISVSTFTPEGSIEHPVLLIPLDGPINQPETGITGMAWFSDTLVLLPQFPDNFENQAGGSAYTIQKADLLALLDGKSNGPVVPQVIPFYAPGIRERIPGFEGFQSLAFSGDRVYLTAVGGPEGAASYLLSGWYEPGLAAITIDTDHPAEIPPQTQLADLGYKSLVSFGRRLATIYEASGAGVNPSPKAPLFGQDLSLATELDFPTIEYRISDATPADDSGRFWATNLFTPTDAPLLPLLDPLTELYGEGQTHRASALVERLIELQFTEQGILLANTPPIQLQLSKDGKTRDWSAIAWLDDRGFLLATGGQPQTLLAFVPLLP